MTESKLRTEAIERYKRHAMQLGYTAEETTLLLIGFVSGWDEVESGLTTLRSKISYPPPRGAK